MLQRIKRSLAFVIILIPGWAWSQAGMDGGISISRPIASATYLDSDPIVDGEVLQDEIWTGLQPIGDLLQTQPNFGTEASEKTDIRIGYSQHTFYVAVVCFDAQPDKLVVSDARRDALLDNNDSFLFILDTYKDGQNGFVFGTNPMGIEYDAQVDNEGQGNFNSNRQQGGVIGGFNLNWDSSWEVKTQVGDYGWSAEFAIPLRSLRYGAGEDQSWGINFRRNIRKTNEVAYWASIPVGFDLKRLSLAGSLTGLTLQNPGNLKVIPYGLIQTVKDYRADPVRTDYNPEFGADIKYSITPAMTLDLTYNTDFAQVEVDQQQVNLDRFNLFFPEKRPFFLENAGIFSLGSPGEVDMFFSRRIGIGAGGSIVPIIGGARLSGKINKTNIGALNMFTDEVVSDSLAENNFTVTRVRHEFAPRSSVGAAFINRTALGENNNYNRTLAVDGKWGLGNKAQLSGFYARTITPGITEGQHAYKLNAQYEWNKWALGGAYTEVGEGFNPEVGFLLRSAFRKPEFRVLYHLRPDDFIGLLELRPHVSYRSYWNFQGFQETSFLHVDNHWEWKNGMEIHTGINFTTEGVVEPFEIYENIFVPDATYNHQEAQLVFWTNKSKVVSFSTRNNIGGFFGGKRWASLTSLTLLAGDKFNAIFSINHNDIKLPGGHFKADIFGTKVSYSFTPRIYLQSLVQYNNVYDKFSANIRLGWLQQANSGLFVVFNSNRTGNFEPYRTLFAGEDVDNRSLIIKYSHVIDVIRK
ncbi:MAG: carbohydrate binding family 9 domain-containing protein [Cyclobacteriaceae bacterium]|nr:carbohydrate binding family 9 domain-containing protein [Cyclobacteriaceae bacterium]